MTWAFRRQMFYVFILVVFFSVFGFLIVFPSLNSTPTCLDNKQNGDETGVDCGGLCASACLYQVDKISVLWSRAFKVVAGRYNAVAYLTNHNRSAAVKKISYKFRFADANNVYIGSRVGATYVPPGQNFAVFEPGIDVGNSIPVYVNFEFTHTPDWVQVSQERINQLQILVSDIRLEDEDISPRLSATIKNNSYFIIPEVGVVAILYDINRNAVSASRTYLDSLMGGEKKVLNFTWPEPLPFKVVTEEIMPLYNIFSVKLK